MSHDPFASYSEKAQVNRPDADRIKVVAIFHKYPPEHNAGAEWMAHTLLRNMVSRGHQVLVLVNRGVVEPGSFEGVSLDRFRNPQQVGALAADVVVTHLDLTRFAVVSAHHYGLPVVHLLHNDRQLQYHRVRPQDASLCIANSAWIRRTYSDWPGPMAVVHPPVDPDEYVVSEKTDDRITLMNLSAAKGGHLFWRLAEAMPHRKFLAVRGAYAQQELPPVIPKNVELIANTPKVVQDVYARTKVLLMPSSYESWGRCAVEAACSGIPTVAHPTEGLVEALQTAAVWADRDDDAEWVDAIDMLYDDPEEYGRVSGLAHARALELDPKLGDYDVFESLMLATVRGCLQGNPHVT